MKHLVFAGVLAMSTLCFNTPAYAVTPPPLPKASSSFTAGPIHVDVYGTPGKPALLFIPGLACGPWEWSGEIAELAPNYTIYALTLPGFDGVPEAQGPLFKTVSDNFWTMLSAHNIVKPVVIGHSLGGTLAIMLAEQHSDRLRGAVAVDGLPIFPGFERQTATQRAQAAQRMSVQLASASTPQQFEFAEKTYALPYMITSKDDVAAVAPLTAKSDPKAAAAWLNEDLTLDLRPSLKNVTIPVLVIAPYDSTLENSMFATPAAKSAYYTMLIAGAPRAEVQVVGGSRHFLMFDQPQRLHEAIAGFLREQAPE